MSAIIDVSMATVYSGGVLTIFCLFQSFFFHFCPLRLQEDNPLLFCVSFDLVCFLEQIHIFSMSSLSAV